MALPMNQKIPQPAANVPSADRNRFSMFRTYYVLRAGLVRVDGSISPRASRSSQLGA